jgi:uncharacterized protein (TIGR02147 family)
LIDNDLQSFKHQLHASDWLTLEYKLRREKNPNYSLRSFAKRLAIPVGRLTELMSRKRNLTERLAKHISDRMEYPPHVRASFLKLVKKKVKDKNPNPKLVSLDIAKYEELNADAFNLVSDWYHYGILNLTEIKDFLPNSKEIAKRLGITTTEVRSAIERLKRLRLLTEENGTLLRTKNRLTTSVDIPSAAIRSSHRQRLQKAIEAIESVPINERDFSTIMFSTNPKFLEKAKVHAEKFRRSMLALAGEFDKERVYTMNIQIFPLSKSEV